MTYNMNDVVAYFSDRLKKYGANDERSLGWSKNKQEVRFKQLFRFLNPGGKEKRETLLDIGCGFADMYAFIEKNANHSNIDYWGMDIVQEFIDIAGKNYPEKLDQLLCGNFLECDERKKYDYCIASGIFCVYESEEQNYEFIKKAMTKALNMSNIGIAMNFLSDKIDYRTSEKDFHASPEKILTLSYGLSRNVILDNSIMPFEFCVTIFKDENFDKDTTIFNYAEAFCKE
ncbi:MAG: class I SAM-dependent methyltransferase [Lachnospiraceae bacterium]|nr:class I SAM-dependent methyltransferase [Lachnospiraceae bacterium]